MRCPSLIELPPPPKGKSGWPWTVETPPASRPGQHNSIKISIVTPSLNQSAFVEETIRSVLLQGYPDLEYIIMDGGSTDGSVDIIKRYEPWLTCWVSEPDRGQADAINKGFTRSQGTVLSWLNSDDYYYQGALHAVANFYQKRQGVIGVGYGDVVDENSKPLCERKITTIDKDAILAWPKNWFLQQACFWPRSCWDAVGGLDEDLRLLMDYDLWLRFASEFDFCFIDSKLACLRYYPDTKSYQERSRSFAEFAVVHVKNNETERAINDIMALYERHRVSKRDQHKILRLARSGLHRMKVAFSNTLR